MLHLVNQTLHPLCALHTLLQPKDAILLLEDGVYQGVKTIHLVNTWLAQGARCYALLPDVSARGIKSNIHPEIELISYEQFVALSVQHHPILSWSA